MPEAETAYQRRLGIVVLVRTILGALLAEAVAAEQHTAWRAPLAPSVLRGGLEKH
jgi:hypothetical protein